MARTLEANVFPITKDSATLAKLSGYYFQAAGAVMTAVGVLDAMPALREAVTEGNVAFSDLAIDALFVLGGATTCVAGAVCRRSSARIDRSLELAAGQQG